MNSYLILIILGVIFYTIDKRVNKCNKKVPVYHELLHLIHNITAITLYLGPFLINDIYPLILLYIGSAFVMVQGCVSKNREQQCFLMPIYNKICGVDENRTLFDIFSITGIKQYSADKFPYVYYIVNLLIYTYLTLKVYNYYS